MTTLLRATGGAEASTHASVTAPRRITPNLFAVGFGLSGLAQTWMVAARHTPAPAAVCDVLWVLAGSVWLVTLVAYVRSVVLGGRTRTELTDQLFGPFVSVPAIVGLLLSGGLEPHAHVAGVTLFWLSLTATLTLAGRLLTIWLLDDTPSTHWHPGYYLPSVGAPLVGAGEAATFGYGQLARLLFGFGVISWMLIGAVLLHHLAGRHRLPEPLLPTMAILLAPPVVASNAWFAINGGRIDDLSLGLAGYAVLMALVQVSLIRTYRSVPFGPGWWSFSFPYATTAGNIVLWLAAGHVAHQELLTYLVLAMITAFITVLAARTVRALVRRTFLP